MNRTFFSLPSRRRVSHCCLAIGVVAGLAAALGLSETRTSATTDRARAVSRSVSEPPRFIEERVPLPGKAEMLPQYLNNRNQILGALLRNTHGAFLSPLSDSTQIAFWDGKNLDIQEGHSGDGLNDLGHFVRFNQNWSEDFISPSRPPACDWEKGRAQQSRANTGE